MQKQQIKNYLKLGIFLFGIFFFFVNCDKDTTQLIEDKTTQTSIIKRISFDDFKLKNTNKTVDFIKPVLDLKRNQTAIHNRDINSVHNSFAISTDEIIEVITDSTASYTFKVTSKLNENHDSEQFMIQHINNEYHYSILGFIYDGNLTNTQLPYKLELLEIDTDLIDMSEFLNSVMSSFVVWSDGCLWQSQEWDDTCGCYKMIKLYCISGGGGSDATGTGDSSSGSETGSSDSSSTNTVTDELPSGESGGGLNPNDNTGLSTTFGIFNPTTKADIVNQCLGFVDMVGSSNYTQAQQDWVNDGNNFIQVSAVAAYLSANGCNQEAQDFALDAIDALMNGDCVVFSMSSNIFNESDNILTNMFGDYNIDINAVQIDHAAVKIEFEAKRDAGNSLQAVQYLINAYSMGNFGINDVNGDYTITFNSSSSIGAATTPQFDVLGNFVIANIDISNGTLFHSDFGYVTRAIKHELLHVLQYKNNPMTQDEREFDAYYFSIFRFKELPVPTKETFNIFAGEAYDSWDNLSGAQKSIRENSYNLLKKYFKKLCHD